MIEQRDIYIFHRTRTTCGWTARPLGLTVKRVAGGYGQQEVESRPLIQASVHGNPDLQRGEAKKMRNNDAGELLL